MSLPPFCPFAVLLLRYFACVWLTRACPMSHALVASGLERAFPQASDSGHQMFPHYMGRSTQIAEPHFLAATTKAPNTKYGTVSKAVQYYCSAPPTWWSTALRSLQTCVRDMQNQDLIVIEHYISRRPSTVHGQGLSPLGPRNPE